MEGCGKVILESGASGMFMGEYHHNVDIKGRLIVPAKFREDLGEVFVLTRGLDQCLFGYPMDEWKIIEEKLKGFPLQKKMPAHLLVFFSQVQQNAKSINKAELIYPPHS